MSKMYPKNQDFMDSIRSVARQYYGGPWWNDDIEVYYDASFYNKRDYVLRMTVKDFKKDESKELRSAMRKAGATNIIGRTRHAICRDYIDYAFNQKIKGVLEYKSIYALEQILKSMGKGSYALEEWAKENGGNVTTKESNGKIYTTEELINLAE